MFSFVRICFFVFIVVVILGISGCVSTIDGSAAGAVGQNQRDFGRVEESAGTIEQYNQFLTDRADKLSESIDRIADNAEVIRRTSDKIEDELSRLEYLIGQYQSETVRVQRELIEERDAIKAYLKDNVVTDSSLSGDDSRKGSRNGS